MRFFCISSVGLQFIIMVWTKIFPKKVTCHFLLLCVSNNYPTNIYLFKLNNRNSRKRCKICSNLTIKTPDQHHFWWPEKTIINSGWIYRRKLIIIATITNQRLSHKLGRLHNVILAFYLYLTCWRSIGRIQHSLVTY